MSLTKTSTLVLLLFSLTFSSCTITLKEFVKWKQIEFADLPEKGNLIQKNVVPQGFAVSKDKLFIAVPRRNIGIPSTLNYIKLDGREFYENPKLYSYPNYETNELNPSNEANANKIISVYRPRVDECNRLWFVDSGVINTSGNATVLQAPAIFVIDLATDAIIKRYEIPNHIVRDGLGLASITIDTIDCNENAFAYIPDLLNSQMLIYSLKDNVAYRMQHNFFRMNPFEGEFDIDGLKFSWDDGIFSITLGKRDDSKDGSYRDAYFHPMISFSEFSISTRIVRNQTLATRSYHGNDVKLLGNRGKNSQSTMHSYHEKSGIIYFAEINKNAVSCWNTRKPLRPSNVKIIARDDIKLIYPSDLSVVDDDLWVMSNRMIRQIYSTLNADDFNFRIFRQPVKDTLAACNAAASRRRKFAN